MTKGERAELELKIQYIYEYNRNPHEVLTELLDRIVKLEKHVELLKSALDSTDVEDTTYLGAWDNGEFYK